MSKKIPKAQWDAVAKKWHTEAGESGVWHQKNDIDPVVLKLLGNVQGKHILEIGAGNGYLSRILAKKGAKVTATDVSSKMIGFAQEREKDAPLGVAYLTRDAAQLEGIKSKSYDAVVANMCLMDIADAKSAIQEVSRVLKKNGQFIFSITHPAFSDFRQSWAIIKQKKEAILCSCCTNLPIFFC